MKNGSAQLCLFSFVIGLSAGACSESKVANLNNGTQKDASTPSGMDAGPMVGPDGGMTGQSDATIMAGEVQLNTDSINFGDVVVTSTSTLILTIHNPASNTVRVSLSSPAGRDADRFTRTIGVSNDNGIFDIAPGKTVEIEVSASPNELGVMFASMALDSCMGTCPVAITLEATGVATGVRCPTNFDIGTVNPGQCISGSVVCENTGNITEVITAVDLTPGTDAEFTLTPTPLPIQFVSNATVGFELEYCPTALGENTGELVVLTFEPTEIEHTIALVGHGGGPDIRCQPATLDLGVGGLNDTLSRDLECENRGNEDLVVSGAVMGTAFTITNAPSVIAAGATMSFTLQVTSATAGTLMDTLQISSNDIDTPTIDIPLSAEFIEAQNCTASLIPSTFDFGLVSVGRAQRAALLIDNPGQTICVIQSVEFVMGSASEFTLINVPAAGDTIAGGANLSFEVAFTPTNASTSTGIVTVNFANPMTAALMANLSGSGGDINLVPSPAQINFGPTPVGCAAPQQSLLELTNVGSQQLTILSVSIVGTSSAAFSVTGLPMGGAQLDRLETLTLNVLFSPSATGPHTAQLRIVVDGQSSPTIVTLSGSGGQQPTRTDVFDFTSPQADVLFVVDDSCSMSQSQLALANDFSSFSDTLVSRGVDLHFAVVTTDMEDQARQGRMLGNPAYVTHTTMDFVTEMESRAQPGTGGSGREMGILAGLRAVTPPLTMGDNMGFLRADADLVVVVLSDEDDQSEDQFLGGGIADAVVSLQAAAGTGRLSVSGIVGPATNNCNGPYGQGRESPRYGEFITRVGDGISLSYCEDMGDNLADLANALFGGPEFFLAAEPMPSSLVVTIDGTATPATNMGQTTWAYDPTSQSIRFTEGNVPANGAQIRVSYTPYCLSPTCGDATMDANEACDDGNMSNDDACTDGCRSAYCGDGFTYMGQEECDDANQDNSDACVAGCLAAVCGDGYVQDGVEECDDGNTANGDACPASCVFPGYNVSQTNNIPYVELNGMNATLLDPQSPSMGGMSTNLDDGVATIQLPFTFDYYGVSTSSITVSVNGVAFMGGFNYQNTAGNQSIPDTDAPNALVAVWWDDLHFIEGQMMYPSGISYEISGMAPNRKLVVQWKNMRHFEQDLPTEGFRRWNFQLIILESNSEIIVHHGESEFIQRQQNFAPYSASVGFENHDGSAGEELMNCTPNCDQGDFDPDESFTLTPR
jgi:cysteine-rich repeat protein